MADLVRMSDIDWTRALYLWIGVILNTQQSQARLAAGQGVRVWDNSVRGNTDIWRAYSAAVIAQYRAEGWRVVDDPTQAFSWLFYREAK